MGCGQTTSATPSRGVASPTRKNRPCAAAATRACSLAQAGPAVRAGSTRARGPPALPAGVGRSPRPVAGWLCQSPRAWAAAHVSRRHVRARPRGLRQLPLQKLLCRGSAPRSGSGPKTPRGGGAWGAEGYSERGGRGDLHRGPFLRLPGSCGLRCSISGWARWRCPGARRPRGAHRLDPGGPAVGRRPQFHGWFGAQ